MNQILQTNSPQKQRNLRFIFTARRNARRNARIARAVLAMAISSVCLSVCHTPVLCQHDGT